jgi:hypothetical protein
MSRLYVGQIMVGSSNETVSQRCFDTSVPENGAPPVPAKDSSNSGSVTPGNEDPSFRPGALTRTTSTFSFSRASFSSQLSALTSITLPQAESLAASIAAIPTASKAIKTLAGAAAQIQTWTDKASKVLKDLDADDDIDWAAAAGREGLDDTDRCVTKFEHLVLVYVQGIEELQTRSDIGDVETDELQGVVEQMEATLEGWEGVRKGLKDIRDQVELAMEWEELWGVVLGDVGNEMDELSRLVFEMEERRHQTLHSDSQNNGNGSLDLSELENIVDENPTMTQASLNHRFSLPPAFASSSPITYPIAEQGHDDSNLLALFARMQPLRASLDFLPMRISMFSSRAGNIFPTACEELEDKRERLEDGWKQLVKEAEDLRRELGEDRWVLVFRNAGRQAQKMCESVERSIIKVQEGIESGLNQSNPAAFTNRVEGFQAKKMHYGPAIDRVLAIIRKGLNDRLTVNGEILRLQSDMSARAQNLTASIRAMDNALEELNGSPNSQLRDSISSVLSMDRSISGTTAAETPGSSPASSVILSTPKTEPPTPTARHPRSSLKSTSHPPISSHNKHHPSAPQPRRSTTPSALPRRVASPAPGAASVYRQGVYSPPTASLPARPALTPVANKPRWSSSGNSTDYRAPSSTAHSLHRKASYSHGSGQFSSPLSRETSISPTLGPRPQLTSKRSNQRLASFAERVASPAHRQNNGNGLLDPVPYHRGGRSATAPVPGTIRSPSSAAVHSNGRPTMTGGSQLPRRPPSSLSQVHTGRKSLPARTSSAVPRSPIKIEDSGIDMRSDDYEEEDELGLEPSSSPLVRPKMAQRPHTTTAVSPSTSVKGRRTSMLPVPSHSKFTSGIDSVLGERTNRP